MIKRGGKLLIITSEFPPNPGGIGNHAYNLAKAFSTLHYQVHVMADVHAVSADELNAFKNSQPFEINFIYRSRFPLATYFERIFKALRLAAQADAIICSNSFSLWLAFLIRIFHPATKMLAVVHGSELKVASYISRTLTKNALRRFNTIVSVSNFTHQLLPASLPASIHSVVIHNGIDNNEVLSGVSGSLQIHGDPCLITVGSITERKGQANVVNALPSILKVFPSAQYHMVGKPVLQKQIEQQASLLKVQENLHFHGAAPRASLLYMLHAATIKLMLSNTIGQHEVEGFGIAILEANALGIPAIGSRNSGIADAIVHNETGILVDEKNPAEIVQAIKTILNNYNMYAANARAWAHKHDWNKLVQEYENLLLAR